MSIGVDLRSWLLTDDELTAIVGDRISQNMVPQDTGTQPYIWFARSSSDRDQDPDLSNPSAEPYRVNWDVECISQDLGIAIQLRDLISKNQQYKGPFGSGTIQGGIFIASASEDYQPRGISSDEGWHVETLDLQTAGYE